MGARRTHLLLGPSASPLGPSAAHLGGTALGFLADLLFGDPRRCHPVAGFGRAAAAAERRLWRDHRGAGALHTALCVGGAAAATRAVQGLALRAASRAVPAPHPAGRTFGVTAGVTPGVTAGVVTGAAGSTGGTYRAHRAERAGRLNRSAATGASRRRRREPVRPAGEVPERSLGLPARTSARVAVVAAVTWAALGGDGLVRQARAIGRALEEGDVRSARALLPNLCGRDPRSLDAEGIARATVESVAENTSDAVVGALVWGAFAGAPGMAAFRAVNTLDAMVGHRSPRHLRFGWAAARLDDLAGWPGSRLTALLAVAAGPRPSGEAPRGALGGAQGGSLAALRAWRGEARLHPSPNAGPVEAAFAGALGVRLGGTLSYAGRVEHRPALNPEGRAVSPRDIERAVRLSRRVGALALVLTLGGGAVRVRAARGVSVRPRGVRRTSGRAVPAAVGGVR